MSRVDPTGDDNIDGILTGWRWDLPANGRPLYYGFPYIQGDSIASRTQIEAVRSIIGEFSRFTALKIQEDWHEGGNDYGREGDLLIWDRLLDEPYLIGELNQVIISTSLNGTDRDLRYPVAGNYAYFIHLQALGSAFGLKYPGYTPTQWNITLPIEKDSLEYTVMSSRAYVGAPEDKNYSDEIDFPQSYMPLDILALQTLYGSKSLNGSPSSYIWNPEDDLIFRTIWDGGGIDTYSASKYTTPVSIDLAPGSYSVLSPDQLAYLGDGVYAKGNVYNAYLFNDDPASLIENAVGGSANDTLRGNIADNALNGGKGADTMIGLTGNDSYVVDQLGDLVVEAPGEGTDTVYVRVTGYVLAANVEQVKIEEKWAGIEVWGNSDANLMAGNDLANTLHGGAGADVLYGMAGADILDGGQGPDQMIGGLGSDTYVVDSLSDVVYEAPDEGGDTLWTSVNRGLDPNFESIVLFGTATDAGGNGQKNTVVGNELNNNLYGGGGSDSLYGHDGNDRLFGEDGNDYMTGGKGTDAYYGGAGYDYAILEQGGGVDYFVDWNVTRDRVVFDSAIFSSIGAALNAAFQNGTDVVIWDGHDGIVLQNAKLADLTTSNFLIT